MNATRWSLPAGVRTWIGPAIQRQSSAFAESHVDRIHDPPGGGKISRVKVEPDDIVLAQGYRHRALDCRAAGDAPDAQMVDLHLAAAGRRARTRRPADCPGHPIDLAIGALERRHQQRAAAQALGIAHAGHRDVDHLAWLGERRQHSRHHHRGHVPQPHVGAGRHIDAHLHQHAGKRLHGERRLNGLIACAVQSDHQPVADQLIRRTPWTEARSLMRSACAGVATTEPQPQDRQSIGKHARRPLQSRCTSSERGNRQEEAREPAHRLRLIDIAVGLVFDRRIGHLDRGDSIVDDSFRPHHARETDVLAALRHGQLLFATYHQVAVGQHINHGNGDGAVKIIGGCRLAFAREIVFG